MHAPLCVMWNFNYACLNRMKFLAVIAVIIKHLVIFIFDNIGLRNRIKQAQWVFFVLRTELLCS